MSTDKHSHIESLNENNYSEWRVNIYGWMLQHHLEEFITTPHPSIPSPGSPAHTAFINRRNEAVGFLLQKLNQKSKTRFVTKENILLPNQLWDAIQKHYASKESPNQGRVLMNFLRITFTSLDQFIIDIRQGLSNLIACDVTDKIDDDMLAEIIVHKFPEHLDTMREIMVDKRPLSTEKVLETLDQHAAEESEKKDKQTALSLRRNTFGAAQAGRFNAAVNRSSRTPRSFPFCSNGVHNDQTQHSREDCYQLHPEKRPSQSNNSRPNRRNQANVIQSQNKTQPPSAENNPFSVLDVYPDHTSSFAGAVRALAVKSTPSDHAKLLDSGCSDHMTSDFNDFATYTPKNATVSLADGSVINIIGEGTMFGKSNGSFLTFHAYHVPKVNGTLISLGKLLLEGCSLKSDGSHFTVVKEDSNILHGTIRDSVLELDLTLD